ncbi:MAG: energy-coupling factor ABC transporter ATP-binding protein [Armatimonadetes bacterium]|nr:energy-coupling factor ABC transporter ATP-binding protein [Armatimonadota bacterium]
MYNISGMYFNYPGETPCLVDVSLDVEPGERVAILGANGSGKSTLLHLLDGLYFPTSGTIRAMGQLLTEESVETAPFGPRFRKEVGFLFQNSDAQLFCSTVEEELAFAPLQIEGWSRDEIMRRIDDTLALLEIQHLRGKTPQNLSAGQKKMVALASVLVIGPSVLLLDEPTTGLDPRSQSMLLEILDHLHDAGLTLITATHDLALLPHLADRALVLNEEHRLVADGPVNDIVSDIDLLLNVNLIHAHTHHHGELAHAHPHYHIVAHEHKHEAGNRE